MNHCYYNISSVSKFIYFASFAAKMAESEDKAKASKLSEADMIDILSHDYVITRRTSTPSGFMGPPDPSMFVKPHGHGQFHKLSTFSGDSPGKGEVLYREWRYEVLCLRSDPEVSEASMINSVRRSLKGTAKQLLIPLGGKATIDEILEKLDLFFGDISTNEMIMQEFFNAFQKPDESVTTFGCRLEMLLSSAVEHGYLKKDAKNDMLRHKFWQSLSSDKLKSQTRHKYDSITSFDQLLAEIRIVEKQIEIAPGQNEKKSSTEKAKNAQHHPQVTHQDLKDLEYRLDSKLEKVSKDMNSKLDDKFNKILQKLDSASLSSQASGSTPPSYSDNYQGRGRGGYGRGRRSGRGGRGRGRGQSRGRGQPPLN